jgi:hypothetical protein
VISKKPLLCGFLRQNAIFRRPLSEWKSRFLPLSLCILDNILVSTAGACSMKRRMNSTTHGIPCAVNGCKYECYRISIFHRCLFAFCLSWRTLYSERIDVLSCLNFSHSKRAPISSSPIAFAIFSFAK